MRIDVKICGLTNVIDARVAIEAGADYLGFVFYPESPRAVSPSTVAGILEQLGQPVRAVGVFVNAHLSEIREAVRICGLSVIQMHGDETAADAAGLPVPVWRAVAYDGALWSPDPSCWAAERYVVDAAAPGQYGGSGVRADWSAAQVLARQFPVLLAGGLCAQNVQDAICSVNPAGVDVSSGVESRPGMKSEDSVRAFIAAVREAERT